MLLILSGDDEFKKQRRITQVLNDSSYTVVHLESPSIEDLIRSLEEAPSLFNLNRNSAQKKAYIIKEFHALKQKDDSESKTHEAQLLELCLASLDRNEEKLIIFNNSSVKGTLKFVKELKKLAGFKQEEFNKFNNWEQAPCLTYLQNLLKEEPSIQISKTDLEKFVNYRGPENLAEIYIEIETLSKSFNPIDFNILQKHYLPKYDVFEFAKSLILKKKVEALKELRKIKQSPEERSNLGLLSLISKQIEIYLSVKTFAKHKFSNDQIAEELGMKSGRVYHLQMDLKDISLSWLEQLSKMVLAYEERIKKGELKLLDAMDLLLHFEENQYASA